MDAHQKAPEVLKEKLQRRGVEAVLVGATWLKTEELHPQISHWHQDGKVFAIEHDGVPYYPNYIFDRMGKPIPEVQELLTIFKGYTPIQVASWFESTSSTLGAKRPREIIESNPQAVVMAAKAHVRGALHG
jgi:hypothetical protein